MTFVPDPSLTALVAKWRQWAETRQRKSSSWDRVDAVASAVDACAAELDAALQQAAPARSAWQDSRGFVLPTYVAVITREDGSVILEGHTRTQDWELEVDAHGAAESFYFQAKPLPAPPTTAGI